MVNDSGQLYTIEGVAAAVLMIVTAYLAVNTAVIYTPQDVHIIDMQLEQLGNDALVVLDTPVSSSGKSVLQTSIEQNKPGWFGDNFTRLINGTTDGNPDRIKYAATIFSRNSTTDTMTAQPFNDPNFSSQYYRENAVNVSRFVHVNPYEGRDQVILLEVMIWRG
jgi:hypothetical protein